MGSHSVTYARQTVLPDWLAVMQHELGGGGLEPVGVYRRIGWKLGAWHDVAWMQRALGAGHDPSPEPR